MGTNTRKRLGRWPSFCGNYALIVKKKKVLFRFMHNCDSFFFWCYRCLKEVSSPELTRSTH
jgi:hypothetical protein